MTEADARPLVAIINTSEELIEVFRMIMEDAGYRSVTAYVLDLKRGEPDINVFLTVHNPPVIIWDIALPYEANWAFFQTVQQSEGAQGRTFVLTTTNERALRELVGPTGAHEIIGKPFDLDAIVEAVQRAFQERETSRP